MKFQFFATETGNEDEHFNSCSNIVISPNRE